MTFQKKRTWCSSSSLHPLPLMGCFLDHYSTLLWQHWENLYPLENDKGCSRCLETWLLFLCKTAWYPLVQILLPPSEPGRVELLWVETPQSCKTPHFASKSSAQHPLHLSQWNIQRGLWDAFYSGEPPPVFAGPGWCYTTAGWHRRDQENLLDDRKK